MKFYIKLKHFAQYRSFKIRDEHQGELYEISGTFKRGMKSLVMEDMNNQVIYTIERKFNLSRVRHYVVTDEVGKEAATVARSRFTSNPVYTVHVGDHVLTFEGDVKKHAFTLHDQEEARVSIEQGTFEFGEAYEITVNAPSRPLLYLFLAIAIDQMNHEREKVKG